MLATQRFNPPIPFIVEREDIRSRLNEKDAETMRAIMNTVFPVKQRCDYLVSHADPLLPFMFIRRQAHIIMMECPITPSIAMIAAAASSVGGRSTEIGGKFIDNMAVHVTADDVNDYLGGKFNGCRSLTVNDTMIADNIDRVMAKLTGKTPARACADAALAFIEDQCMHDPTKGMSAMFRLITSKEMGHVLSRYPHEVASRVGIRIDNVVVRTASFCGYDINFVDTVMTCPAARPPEFDTAATRFVQCVGWFVVHDLLHRQT